MKFLENLFKKQEPLFEKGAKLGAFHELFHAGYSFFYNNHINTKTNVHIRDSLDTKRYMSIVIIALMPALFFGIYNAGLQSHLGANLEINFLDVMFTGASMVLPIVAVSYIAGLSMEFLFASIRGHAVNEGYLVTGLIYPLILPITIPLWQVAAGAIFGVVVAKEVFGGTGRNFLNPALTARAFVFFSYPVNMSGDIWSSLLVAKDQVVDGFSGATALSIAYQTPAGSSASEALTNYGFTLDKLFFGFVPGSIGETSVVAILIGAFILIITGIGSWRTMLSGIVGLISASFIFNFFGSDATPLSQMSWMWHLCMGGFLFSIIFIATDPVSSPYLKTSLFIYGFLIGFVGLLIRVFNPAYIESWMLIILLMNVFAPLIDHIVLQIKKRERIPNLV
jgi:Na+-transporting NADH:ubiquinone oxidoreductase subunit B